MRRLLGLLCEVSVSFIFHVESGVKRKWDRLGIEYIPTITIRLGMKCSNSPGPGACLGQLEAQKREKGMMPSLEISWLTRDWANVMVRTLPRAERATKTDITRFAVVPKTLPTWLLLALGF